MSVISLCVCKKRGCFRLDGRQPTQDMPSCHYKTKQLLCLCFSTQICSLPPPQPQLSTASQAPRTSSPLPAQVSPPAESKYLHTKSTPESLLFQPPLPQTGLKTMTNDPMVQLVAAEFLPLPAAPFQRPRTVKLFQLFSALAMSLTHGQISPPGPSSGAALVKTAG